MARIARPWWQQVSAVLLVLLAARAAEGTTFVLMDEGELASRSVAVITGTVQQVQVADDETNGGVNTYVYIQPDGVIAGAVPDGDVVLKETGGRTAAREETVYGSPDYAPGEKVLAFLSRSSDGTLRTTGMSMGKYRLSGDNAAYLSVSRTFGSGVTVLRRVASRFGAASVRPDTAKLEDVIARIRAGASAAGDSGYSAPVVWRPAELDHIAGQYQASFSYLSSPARWWEPKNGLPVTFLIDPTGDAKIGSSASINAIHQAFAAWSSITSTMLHLDEAGTTPQQPYAGCGGGSRIIFGDPYNEITDPTNCGGILAIGGYCASWETEDINGVPYRRIAVGKVMLNNGWEKCAGWNACNLAEVVTHEIGHAIGLGHSADGYATMSPSAHFDGRCAQVESDDRAGALSLYADPNAIVVEESLPTPTGTPTSAPAPPTNSPVPTRTATNVVATRTPTPAVSRTVTQTRTITRTKTKTPTRRPTWTKTPTILRTPRPTRTPYMTWTPRNTRTRTATRTRTLTRTPTRTRTPRPTNTLPPSSSASDAWQSQSWDDWVAQLIRAWSSWSPSQPSS